MDAINLRCQAGSLALMIELNRRYSADSFRSSTSRGWPCVDAALTGQATMGCRAPHQAPARGRVPPSATFHFLLLFALPQRPQRTTAIAIAPPRSHKLAAAPQPAISLSDHTLWLEVEEGRDKRAHTQHKHQRWPELYRGDGKTELALY